jgi:hypothetical protein
MRRIGRVFQPKRLPPSTSYYPDPRNHGLFGSAFLTSWKHKPDALKACGLPAFATVPDLRLEKPEAGRGCNRIGIPSRAH